MSMYRDLHGFWHIQVGLSTTLASPTDGLVKRIPSSVPGGPCGRRGVQCVCVPGPHAGSTRSREGGAFRGSWSMKKQGKVGGEPSNLGNIYMAMLF